MGKRPLSRREQEERRKREEETAAAHVRNEIYLPCISIPINSNKSKQIFYSLQAFKEFVETFQEAPSTVSKVWVKAGVYDAGTRRTYSIFV